MKKKVKNRRLFKRKLLKPRPCPNCHRINAPTSSFCSKCGHPITEMAMHDVEYNADSIQQILVENPQAQTVLFK